MIFKFDIGSVFLKFTSKINGKELLFPAEIDYENCDRPFLRNKVTTFLVDNPNAVEVYLYILENNEYLAYRITYSSKDDKVHLCKCINENFEIIGVYDCYYRPLLNNKVKLYNFKNLTCLSTKACLILINIL